MEKPWEYPSAAVEQAILLGVLRDPERLLSLRNSGLSSEDFGPSRAIFLFIQDYADRYNGVPGEDVVQQRFPEEWKPPEGGAYDYWLGEFRKHAIARRLQLAIQDAMRDLGDPEKAATQLAERVQSIRLSGQSHVIATDAGANEAFQKYQMRKDMFVESGGRHIFGIRTSFKVINNTYLGWLPGELVGIYARPTVGKTWVLIRDAVEAWMQGYRVLFISPEMPANQLNIRIYTMMAYAMGIPFSHQAVYHGDPAVERSFQQLVEQLQPHNRWFTIDGLEDGTQVGLREVKQLARQHGPDIIYIDGISLLNNEAGPRTAEWERMKYNSYGLKHFATQSTTPIVLTHQSINLARGRKDEGKNTQGRGDDFRMPTLNDAAFGDSFVQAMSTVITMRSDENRRDIRWYAPRKVREREVDFSTLSYALYWNVDHGQIDDISEYGTDIGQIAQHIGRIAGARAS